MQTTLKNLDGVAQPFTLSGLSWDPASHILPESVYSDTVRCVAQICTKQQASPESP